MVLRHSCCLYAAHSATITCGLATKASRFLCVGYPLYQAGPPSELAAAVRVVSCIHWGQWSKGSKGRGKCTVYVCKCPHKKCHSWIPHRNTCAQPHVLTLYSTSPALHLGASHLTYTGYATGTVMPLVSHWLAKRTRCRDWLLEKIHCRDWLLEK